MVDEKIVQFGISNVKYSVYDETTSTYGSYVPLIGATTLNLSPEGSTNSVYADNIVYYQTVKNSGYSGSLTLLHVPDQFLEDVFGFVVSDGALLEPTDVQPKQVALLFKVDGNLRDEATVLYNVTFSRPNNENSTNEDSISTKSVSLDLTAVGRDMTVSGTTRNVVKATIENTPENADKYTAFLAGVYMPATTTDTGA